MQLRNGARLNVLLVLVGIAAFAAAAVFLLVRSGSERGPGQPAAVRLGPLDGRALAVGAPAPDFALASVRNEGEVVRLSSFRGRAVVVNFYASWCGPCLRELPEFEVVAREFADEAVVLAVNVQESRADALRVLVETGVTFPAVVDADGDVARRYGLRGMPSTYLVDREGVLRRFGPGALDAETLRAALREVLAGGQ